MHGLTTKKLAAATALAILGAACSGGGAVTTEVLASSSAPSSSVAPPPTSDADEPVVFGSGSIPDTMPGGFPFPAEAVIGSTLIDHNRALTEVIFRVPVGVEALAGFFDANLPGRGYEVTASAGTGSSWELAFAGDTATGTIVITLGAQDVSQAVVRVTALG